MHSPARRLMVSLLLAGITAVATTTRAAAPPAAVQLHPDNPRYLEWKGKPLLLITSAEHYGAVLNADFNFRKYLDALGAAGMNHTRLFIGGMYVEPQGAFNIERNTLAPAAGRYLAPYARSDQPGYAGGGNKFDLNRWDEAYFRRLRTFLAQAARRGIVVEVNLFCVLYEDPQWRLSPYHPDNNVNALPPIRREDVLTLDRSGPYLELQERLARKVVEELKDFGNLYYEIINEPYITQTPDNWQRHLTDVVVDAQREHAQPKLISWNIANNTAVITNPHPAISIFNFHYAAPPDAVEMNWNLHRVIGDNETGFRGTNDAPYRMEGWDFLMAGGGLFNNLDYSFTVGHEDGTFQYPATQPGGGSPGFREQIRHLVRFMNALPFVRMQPDSTVFLFGVPASHSARALVEPGRTIAAYFRPRTVTRFSARWTGFVEVPESGTYTFHTQSNDGVRLWIDGQPLIDNWTDHGETEDTGSIELESGRRYNLRLEYFYNGGQAVMKLAWSQPGQPRQPIPATALRPPEGPGHGLHAEYFAGTNFDSPWNTRRDPQVNFAWGTASPFPTPTAPPGGRLRMALPEGRWQADWLDPQSGRWIARQAVQATSGQATLILPKFTEDMALRITRREGP